jgi:hypothetical protein
MVEEAKPFTMQLKFNNDAEGWDFPVLPEKIDIKRAGSGKEYKLIGAGAISTIEKPELAEISFESFFPAENYPFVQNVVHRNKTTEKPEPNLYVNDINRWMHSGYPIRFVYIGQNAENDRIRIFLPMTIVSFERWEEAGSPGDIFFKLKLKEYVFYQPQRVRPVKQPDGSTLLVKEKPKRPDERIPEKTHTLKAGETLIYVAKMKLGDSGRWREIQALNKITDSQLRKIPVGTVLQLPERRI